MESNIGTCAYCGRQEIGVSNEVATAECGCERAKEERRKDENCRRIDKAIAEIENICQIQDTSMLLSTIRNGAMLVLFQSLKKVVYQFDAWKVTVSMNTKEKIVFAITNSTGVKFEV